MTKAKGGQGDQGKEYSANIVLPGKRQECLTRPNVGV